MGIENQKLTAFFPLYEHVLTSIHVVEVEKIYIMPDIWHGDYFTPKL